MGDMNNDVKWRTSTRWGALPSYEIARGCKSRTGPVGIWDPHTHQKVAMEAMETDEDSLKLVVNK